MEYITASAHPTPKAKPRKNPITAPAGKFNSYPWPIRKQGKRRLKFIWPPCGRERGHIIFAIHVHRYTTGGEHDEAKSGENQEVSHEEQLSSLRAFFAPRVSSTLTSKQRKSKQIFGFQRSLSEQVSLRELEPPEP